VTRHPPAPRYPFCWWCSRKLQGNAHRLVVFGGVHHVVHVNCVKPMIADYPGATVTAPEPRRD
jgi:hypothetical protein